MARPFLARLTRVAFAAAVLWATIGAGGAVLAAEAPAAAAADRALRERVERQYEVLPLHNGVLLRSRDARPRLSIEVADSRIAIDGVEATGPELRRQLGADADLVLQLSYLDAQTLHVLFGLHRRRLGRRPASGSRPRR